MPLHLDEVVKRVGSIQVACMNEAHEQITHSGAVQRLVEERVLAMQNGFLQSTLDDVMPPTGLCRVVGFPNLPAYFLMVADAA